MPSDDRVVHLRPPNLDGRFGRVRYAAAFDLPACFLRMYHVVSPFLVDSVQLLRLLFVGEVAVMDLA
jgi:hypothetical protein